MHETNIAADAATESRARFTCEPRALADAVALLASRVIEQRNRVPILACLMIDARPDGRLILQGTDLDVQARITIAAKVESPGAFCTDAANLKAMLAKLKKVGRDAVAIEDAQPGRAVLVIGRNRFNLPTLPVDDFPMLASPTVDETADTPLSAFTVDRGQLVRDLAALAPCISTEETRYYLNGIAMQRREMAGRERLVMVATSGKEIGIASRALPAGADGLADCILPRKAVALIGHAAKLADPTEGIEVQAGERFAFTISNVEIVAKQIDGTFPDWTRCFDSDLAPTDHAEPVLFPDLLPGVPVAKMEKLEKAAGGEIDWSNAYHGRLGSVSGDPDMLFGVWVDPRNTDAPAGYSYVDEHLQFTVDGDATVYPVATKGGRVNLSAAQVAEIVGESAFETMEVTRADGSKAHILKWLWDDGASRFLAVRPDGRCFNAKHGGEGALIDRAEIEAVMAGATVEMEAPASAPEAAQERVEAVEATPHTTEPVSCSCSPETGSSVVTEESRDMLDAQGEAMAAFIETLDTLPAVSAVTPTARAKRTPAHERAIRRAWAERKARRDAALMAGYWESTYRDEHERHKKSREHATDCFASYMQGKEKRRRAVLKAREMQAELREAIRCRDALRADCHEWEALQHRTWTESMGHKAKRRRSTLLARQRGKGLVAMHNVARARIDELQADLAKARQAPTYFDDTGMERHDAAAVAFDQGRHALDKAEKLERQLSEARAAVARQQASIDTLSAEYETMAMRALKAERTVAALEARLNGWPPAVRTVGVNFALAG